VLFQFVEQTAGLTLRVMPSIVDKDGAQGHLRETIDSGWIPLQQIIDDTVSADQSLFIARCVGSCALRSDQVGNT
jgi:hypothetical protein